MLYFGLQNYSKNLYQQNQCHVSSEGLLKSFREFIGFKKIWHLNIPYIKNIDYLCTRIHLTVKLKKQHAKYQKF